MSNVKISGEEADIGEAGSKQHVRPEYFHILCRDLIQQNQSY